MKMRQKLAEAEGVTSKAPKDNKEDYWYARGVQDTIELLLPDVISWRKTREWLKDWALSIPLEDLEAVVG